MVEVLAQIVNYNGKDLSLLQPWKYVLYSFVQFCNKRELFWESEDIEGNHIGHIGQMSQVMGVILILLPIQSSTLNFNGPFIYFISHRLQL